MGENFAHSDQPDELCKRLRATLVRNYINFQRSFLNVFSFQYTKQHCNAIQLLHVTPEELADKIELCKILDFQLLAFIV
jgi:hypothetical protein